MSHSNSNVSKSEILASSDEKTPFDSLLERNPARRQRKVYAQYRPLSGLRGIPIPGTLHWAVQTVSDTEIADDEPGYIWELAQTQAKLTINVSSWPGAKSKQKHLLGYTNLTDGEICDCGSSSYLYRIPNIISLTDSWIASEVLHHMNTDNFGFLDEVTRLYLRPVGLAHSVSLDPLYLRCSLHW